MLDDIASPVNSPPPPDLASVATRREAGHEVRRHVPRSAHAAWAPPAGRLDPVALLIEADRTRIPALLPIRYGRMMADPFAFLRGSAAVMAADLARLPATNLRVQACGDCHLMNFGAYASPEGTPVFDVNDFDETLPAPFEWDLKRLAASLAVAGAAQKLGGKACRTLARRSVHAYRRHMIELSRMAPLDAWRSRIDLVDAVDDVGDRDVRRQERTRLHGAVQAGREAYRRLIATDGTLRLPERPPAVYRLGAQEQVAHAAFAAYERTLAEERRVLVARYRLRDVAFKAVGVGSVGTFCAIGLFATADNDVLLLQLKESQRSVLAAHAGESVYANQGERVVVGQRMLQAVVDVFLGWAEGGPEGRDFYVRQLKDSRLAAVGAQIAGEALGLYARLCGRTLARAHARSGDAATIAGYLGESAAFDEALAEFAMMYAAQTDRDHQAFLAAIADRRIEAVGEKR